MHGIDDALSLTSGSGTRSLGVVRDEQEEDN